LTRSLSLQTRNPKHPFHADPYVLRSIKIQSFDLFGGSRLGFIKLVAEVTNSARQRLPGAVFLRGPSVAMLVFLIPDDAPREARREDRHVLLTVQPRIAAGSLAFVELPAGMVDEVGNFAGTAAREIREELGLEIPASELKCLSELAAPSDAVAAAGSEDPDNAEILPQAMFPSPGGCDEYIPIYMHERRVPRAQLSEWTGRLTGLREDGEMITLKLVKLDELAWRPWPSGRVW
jgi:8-oxo-dGTP pyrophosphatase MutT (NUDIX family)